MESTNRKKSKGEEKLHDAKRMVLEEINRTINDKRKDATQK